MGGADYTKLAIPGSYINVMDFKTVKQLAEYLQYLDKTIRPTTNILNGEKNTK